ncbi:MAG: hypothetical protein PHQ04_10550 [Opitutaceae bacterium]|nr:hypothetical protein [Opitutaceae bacterium]
MLGTLALTGAILQPVEDCLGKRVSSAAGEANIPIARELAGQGVLPALLGGFRGLAADGFWLRAALAWERNDLPATHLLLRLTVLTDPQPLYFWINGARIMAYDMPVWRVRQAGGEMPSSIVRRISEEQAQLALDFLKQACRYHYNHPALAVEMANIHLWRRGDMAQAADYYRRAAEMPGAPHYAARIHAELLRLLGRKREALVWLQALHSRLPVNEKAAECDIVQARIKELERELNGTERPDAR